MEYNNPDHVLPTKQMSFGSEGNEIIIRNFYPQDLILSGNEEVARQALISRNILSPTLEQHLIKAGNPISKSKVAFSVFPNGLVLPRYYFTQTGNNSFEKRVEFFNYNNSGKLLQQAKVGDTNQSYIYGYAENLPIAQAFNAAHTEIAYTSFESAGKGNWEFSGSSHHDLSSPTGTNNYSLLNGNLISPGLDPVKTYQISYWLKGSTAANVSNSLTIIQGETKDGWTYFEHKISGASHASISGSGDIDEVRLYPAGASMVTFTYDPIVGITSKVDENNIITYYHYDAAGRLSFVKDSKGNTIKKIDYKYANQ